MIIKRIADLLGAAKQVRPGSYIARCPVHKDRKPSLHISEDDKGHVWAHCYAGCKKSEIEAALIHLDASLKDRFRDPPPDIGQPITKIGSDDETKRYQITRCAQMWRDAQELTVDGPGATYLKNRGLTEYPDNVFRELHEPEHKTMRLLAKMVDMQGAFAGVHAISLNMDGSVQTEEGGRKKKYSLGAVKGCGVHLPGTGTPVVCEGVEDALSLWGPSRRNVWATCGLWNMSTMGVGSGAELLLVKDYDPPKGGSGESKATKKFWSECSKLQARGVAVQYAEPVPVDQKLKRDANDVLMEEGPDGITALLASAKDMPTSQLPRDWYDRYCYVASVDRIIDTHDPQMPMYNQKSFNGIHAGQEFPLSGKSSAWTRYMEDDDAWKVNDMTFLPGQDLVVESAGGSLSLNRWKGLAVDPQPHYHGIWMEHFEWLVPSALDREVLLDWMAFTLQFPGEKANFAVLMGSRYEGIGKDLLLTPLRTILGSHAVEIHSEYLESSFNQWLDTTKLLIVGELMSGHRYDMTNRMKPLIAAPPDTLQINIKNVNTYSIPNIVNLWAMTNSRQALSLSNEDRRWFVLWSENKPQDPDYYTKLAEHVRDPDVVAGIMHMLMNRPMDVVRERLKGKAPKTQSHIDMVKIGGNPVDEAVRECIETPIHPISLVYPADLLPEVQAYAPHANLKTIKLALERMGWLPLETRAHIKVVTREIRATMYADPDKAAEFEALSPRELGDYYSILMDNRQSMLDDTHAF